MVWKPVVLSGLVVAPVLCGCTTTVKEVASPSNITLDAAMLDVAQSLQGLKDYEEAYKLKLGMIVDEVDLNFQITANASSDGKLGVSLSTPAVVPVNLGLSASDDRVISGERGSTIKVTLKSVITAPLNEVGCYYFIPEYMQSKKDCSGSKAATDSSAAAPAKPAPAPAKKVARVSGPMKLSSAANSYMQTLLEKDHLPFRVSSVDVR